MFKYIVTSLVTRLRGLIDQGNTEMGIVYTFNPWKISFFPKSQVLNRIINKFPKAGRNHANKIQNWNQNTNKNAVGKDYRETLARSSYNLK